MRHFILPCLVTTALAGCAQTGPAPVSSALDPMQLESIQTRSFATADRAFALRQIIGTLQDLGYSVDKVDATAGAVAATKAANLSITAMVRPGADNTMLIHADAYMAVGASAYQVDDPTFYNADFFTPLARNIPPSAGPAMPPSSLPPAYAPPPAYPSAAPSADEAPSSNAPWHESPSP